MSTTPSVVANVDSLLQQYVTNQDDGALFSLANLFLGYAVDGHNEATLREASDEFIRANGLIPLLKEMQSIPYDPLTLQPLPPFSEKQQAVLNLACSLITAADRVLQHSGWEIIEAPEDKRPAYLHTESSVLRNTPPDDCEWPCERSSGSINTTTIASAAGGAGAGGAAGSMTWSRQLLLHVPTLTVPIAAASADDEGGGGGSANHESSSAGDSFRLQRLRQQKTGRKTTTPGAQRASFLSSSTATTTVASAVSTGCGGGGGVRWPVAVVEHVPCSHSVLDVLVDGKADVTFRQLLRHDLDGSWRHTEGLASVEIQVELKVETQVGGEEVTGLPQTTTPNAGNPTTPAALLVPARSAHPLSFTKTTMAALPLLAAQCNPLDRRQRRRRKRMSVGDSGGGAAAAAAMLEEGGLEGGFAGFGGEFDEEFEQKLLEAMMQAQWATEGGTGDSDKDEHAGGHGGDGGNVESDENATAEEEEAGQAEEPFRVLVLGLSNCCDLVNFVRSQRPRARVDCLDAYGLRGESVLRVAHLRQHFNLSLTSTSTDDDSTDDNGDGDGDDACYVSLEQPSLLRALRALEADGESPPPFAEVAAKGNAAAGAGAEEEGAEDLGGQYYDAVYLDWAAETGLLALEKSQEGAAAAAAGGASAAKGINGAGATATAAAAAAAAEAAGRVPVTEELLCVVDKVAPWVGPSGLLCVGMGPGWWASQQDSKHLQEQRQQHGGGLPFSSGALLAKRCASSGLLACCAVADKSFQEHEPLLAETVFVAARSQAVLKRCLRPQQQEEPVEGQQEGGRQQQQRQQQQQRLPMLLLESDFVGGDAADASADASAAAAAAAAGGGGGGECNGHGLGTAWVYWVGSSNEDEDGAAVEAGPGVPASSSVPGRGEVVAAAEASSSPAEAPVEAHLWEDVFGSDDDDDDEEEDNDVDRGDNGSGGGAAAAAAAAGSCEGGGISNSKEEGGEGGDEEKKEQHEDALLRTAWDSVLPAEVRRTCPDTTVLNALRLQASSGSRLRRGSGGGEEGAARKGVGKSMSSVDKSDTAAKGTAQAEDSNAPTRVDDGSAEVRLPAQFLNGDTARYLFEHGYAVCPATAAAASTESPTTANTANPSTTHEDPLLLRHVLDVVVSLQRRKLPPAFCFMFDSTWELALRLWPLAEALLLPPRPRKLGDDAVADAADDGEFESRVVLEPSFAAFRLDHKQGWQGHRTYVGNNFGKPHRDYSFADSWMLDDSAEDNQDSGDNEGDDDDDNTHADTPGSAQEGQEQTRPLRPKVLSVWLPLNAVTTHNGCMYAVPKAKDPAFFDPTGCEGLQEPSVPTGSLTPLAPHPAGSFMCWSGNTIHWGSSCSQQGRQDPRTSLAFVFRVKSEALSVRERSFSKRDVASATTAQRLEWVLGALRFFSHWYPEADLSRFPLPGAARP